MRFVSLVIANAAPDIGLAPTRDASDGVTPRSWASCALYSFA